MFSRARRLLLALTLTLAATTLTASTGYAQAGPPDDRVLVLDWAPTTQARALELITDAVTGASAGGDAAQATVRDNGVARLLPIAAQPRVLSDLKVLPNGAILLTSRTDASVLLYSPASGALTTLYESVQPEYTLLESASALSYAAQGQPTQLLFTDSYASLGVVHEVDTGLRPYQAVLQLGVGRGFMVQGVVMPEGRVAFATNWSNGQLWGVDVVDLSFATGDQQAFTRFANKAHQGSPPNLTLIEDMGELRELMALDAETLLVTTRFEVFTLKLDGTRPWRLDIGQHPELGGEFASARALPTGRIAVATFEPGRWTAPHTNHRVHWFAAPQPGVAPARLASSEALDRAPRRVEAASGTGGTGTLGFAAGLGALEPGSLDDLSVSAPLTITPDPVTEGAPLTARIDLRNDATRVVSLKRVTILATPGATCDPQPGATPTLLAETRDLVIAPSATTTVQGTLNAETPLAPGPWCAQVTLEDTSGRVLDLDGATPFTIAADTSGPNQSDRQDLNLRRPGDDMGAPDMGGPDAGSGDDGGCQCGQAPTRAPLPLGLLWIVALLAVRPHPRASRCPSPQDAERGDSRL